MNCEKCGKPMSHSGTMVTAMGYASPKGHNHDDNCRGRIYFCACGYKVGVWRRNRCPVTGCSWAGKDTCSTCCTPGVIRVDEWPD